jgi:heme exporter protein D
MHWNSVDEFFAMGGYALYVWGSFAVTFIAMGIELWLINQRRKNAAKMVE